MTSNPYQTALSSFRSFNVKLKVCGNEAFNIAGTFQFTNSPSNNVVFGSDMRAFYSLVFADGVVCKIVSQALFNDTSHAVAYTSGMVQF